MKKKRIPGVHEIANDNAYSAPVMTAIPWIMPATHTVASEITGTMYVVMDCP